MVCFPLFVSLSEKITHELSDLKEPIKKFLMSLIKTDNWLMREIYGNWSKRSIEPQPILNDFRDTF